MRPTPLRVSDSDTSSDEDSSDDGKKGDKEDDLSKIDIKFLKTGT